MNEPLISVIVPVYKVEKYLDECVGSIVDQTYRNLEIILVDDGSPDNCPQMCDDWAKKDERIYVIHKENGGAASARNAGLDVCKGEYVTFVDSDDWVESDWLIKSICYLNENAIVITGFVIHDICKDKGKNFLFSKEVQRIKLEDVLSYWNYDVLYYMCSKIYSNRLIQKERIRFSEMTIGEDTAFTLCFLKYALYGMYVPDLGYHYRRYIGNTASKEYREGHFESMCELYFVKKAYIIDVYPVKEEVKNKILKESFEGILWQLDNIDHLPISKKERYELISLKMKSKKFQFILNEQHTLGAFLLKYANYQVYTFAKRIRDKLLRR